MTTPSSEHPFFEETSLYNRLRSRLRPDEKLVGYFLWLQEQRERQDQEARKQEQEAGNMAALSLPADRGKLAARSRRDRPAIAIRVDDPDRLIAVKPGFPPGETIDSFICDALIEDQKERPSAGSHCRMLLVSPAMLRTLRGYLREDGGPLELDADDELAIRQLFHGDVLDTSLEAARMLAAAPEMAGVFGEEGKTCSDRRIRIPPNSPNVPNDVYLVVVFDPTVAG